MVGIYDPRAVPIFIIKLKVKTLQFIAATLVSIKIKENPK
jgi:hypothetical protein